MRKDVYPIAGPQELGVSPDAIDAAIRDIRETNGLELHSFLMLRRGVLIKEAYFRQGEAGRRHVLFSVSKSFLSTAIGLAQAQGLLRLTDKLYDFFPEHASLCDSEFKRAIELRHLLMMGSGFANEEMRIFGQGKDFTRSALAQPVLYQPGTVFNYYTLGSFLLSAVFSRVCPEGIYTYLKRKLFGPMDFGGSDWEEEPGGIPLGGTGLYLTAYDMTKLGQLYLKEGCWEGQALLPAAYIREATQRQIDNAPAYTNPDWRAGYGYQFWRNAFGGFRADGSQGQYIVVLPEKEAVIVMTSRLKNMQIPLTAIADHLLPGMDG